jgi:hypothetical protein
MYCNYLYNIFLFDIKAVPEKHLSNKEKCTETLSLQRFENEILFSYWFYSRVVKSFQVIPVHLTAPYSTI